MPLQKVRYGNEKLEKGCSDLYDYVSAVINGCVRQFYAGR